MEFLKFLEYLYYLIDYMILKKKEIVYLINGIWIGYLIYRLNIKIKIGLKYIIGLYVNVKL